MPLRDILTALLVVTLLGVNFVAIKIALVEIPPILLTALRFLLAAVPAVFFIVRPRTSWRLLVGFGFAFGVVQFALLFEAIQMGMPAGLSSLVMQMQVFFTIVLAGIVMAERPTRLQSAGAMLGALGIVVIAVGMGRTAALLPMLMVLAAAFSWSISNILVKRAGRVDMLALVVWGSLVATGPLLALSLVLEGPRADLRALAGIGWLSALAIAFIVYPTTLLALSLWNRLLSRYSAATVTPFALLVPIAGIASTHFTFGEAFGAPEAMGSVLVFAGLALNVWAVRMAGRRALAA